MKQLFTLLLALGIAFFPTASQVVVDKAEMTSLKLQRYQTTELKHTKQLKHRVLGKTNVPDAANESSVSLKNLTNQTALEQELPYVNNFDNMPSYSVVDANNDGITWNFFKNESCMLFEGNSTTSADDWLIFDTPLIIKAGENHIVFSYLPRYTNPKESFEVYMGTSTNHTEMKKIGEMLEFYGFSSYRKFSVDFTIETDDQYYFAIRAISPINHGGFYIDDLEVAAGIYVGNPNAGLVNVLMPNPSPNLTSSEKISLVVENTGEEDIKSLTVNWYDYNTNNKAGYFNKVFSTPIEPNTSAEIQLENDMTGVDGFDFSTLGLHQYKFEITDVISSNNQPELDSKLSNNIMIGSTSHLESDVTLPFFVDFSERNYTTLWYSCNGVWFFDDYENYSIVGSDIAPLYSTAVSLKSGENYRFEYEALIGTDIDGYYAFSTDFNIRVGKSGTDISEWQVINDVEWGINEQFEEFDCKFSVEEDGEYQFAIMITSNGGLELRKISVSRVHDYELRMTQAIAPTMIPLTLANGFHTSGAFVNKGARMVNGKFDLKNGDEILGSYTENEITPSYSGEFIIVSKKANATVGEELDLTIVPSVVGHDDAAIRTAQLPKTIITKDILGYDLITEDMLNIDNSVGCEPNSDITCAMVFTLVEDAVVTGIQIGWTNDATTTNAISIREYSPYESIVGDVILEDVVSKESGYHFGTYPLTPRKLPAGTYAALVTLHDYQIAADWDNENYAYILHSNGKNLIPQPQVGAVAIRLQFGEFESKSTDVAVLEISQPATSGYFYSNEPIVARVTQLGSEEVEAVATLNINDKKIDEKNITIPAFSEIEVEFKADLLAVGEYKIEVSLSAQGDVNPLNNSCSLTVQSLGELSPYVLDFEACEDFSIDLLTPSWTMYDEFGDYTYGLGDHIFPNAGEEFAFMVFNVWETDFEEGSALFNNLLPHGGRRYGAAFCEYDMQNNDWLISPKLLMHNDNPELRFFARSYTLDYGAETFSVLVSETDNDISSFISIMDAEADYTEWTEVVVPLTEYAGKEIHVAIECTSEDRYLFMIDDISITEPLSSITNIETETYVSLYPTIATEAVAITSTSEIQSVTICSISGQVIYQMDGNGNNALRINVSDIESGIYFAQINTITGTRTIRFVVK